MDPISDMITRIRNAQGVKRQELFVPYSNFKFAVASVLHKEGYLSFCKIEGEDKKKQIKVGLKYDKNNQPVINSIKKISKSGRRRYLPRKKLPKVLQGLGMVIVSTSRGVMSNREARKRNLGGEVVCEVW